MKILKRIYITLFIHLRMHYLNTRDKFLRFKNKSYLANCKNTLAIQIDADCGLFAQLNWCLVIVWYAQQRGLIPQISAISKNYGGNGVNWFPLLFCNNPDDILQEKTLKINRYQELPFSLHAPTHLSFNELHDLQNRYFPVQNTIQENINNFVKNNFTGYFVIGVLYRGTDKLIESDRVNYDDIVKIISREIEKSSRQCAIFVATDEASFFEYLKERFTNINIITANHRMSKSTQAVHKESRFHGTQLAMEALTDSLLLSRCSLLIKTPSFLSTFSKVFNPSLEVILVGRPRANALWFPDILLYS